MKNGVVFDLPLNRKKFGFNWETKTFFINYYLKLYGNDLVLLKPFVSSSNAIKKKVSAFGRNKNYKEKQKFLQQILVLPTKLKKMSRKNASKIMIMVIIFKMTLKYSKLKPFFNPFMTV